MTPSLLVSEAAGSPALKPEYSILHAASYRESPPCPSPALNLRTVSRRPQPTPTLTTRADVSFYSAASGLIHSAAQWSSPGRPRRSLAQPPAPAARLRDSPAATTGPSPAEAHLPAGSAQARACAVVGRSSAAWLRGRSRLPRAVGPPARPPIPILRGAT